MKANAVTQDLGDEKDEELVSYTLDQSKKVSTHAKRQRLRSRIKKQCSQAKIMLSVSLETKIDAKAIKEEEKVEVDQEFEDK